MINQKLRQRRARLMRRRASGAKERAIVTMLGVCMAVFAFGGTINSLTNSQHFNAVSPTELNASVRKDGHPFRVSMPPMDIVFHVVTKKEFASMEPSNIAAVATFSDGRAPCKITIPEGFILRGVYGDVSSTYEDFDDTDMPKYLAHEMIHCIVGHWHRPDL